MDAKTNNQIEANDTFAEIDTERQRLIDQFCRGHRDVVSFSVDHSEEPTTIDLSIVSVTLGDVDDDNPSYPRGCTYYFNVSQARRLRDRLSSLINMLDEQQPKRQRRTSSTPTN